MENKTYLLEEAKELVKNGTHQIYNDCDDNEMLVKIFGDEPLGKVEYYALNDCDNVPLKDLEIIPLSAIADIKWGDEVQCRNENGWSSSQWFYCSQNPRDERYVVVSFEGIPYRFDHIRKPVPNFDSLIKSTQEAADQIAKGYVVKIEKL